MPTKGNPKVYARLDPAIRAQLEEVARAQGVTLSEAVRAAIIAFIAQHAQQK